MKKSHITLKDKTKGQNIFIQIDKMCCHQEKLIKVASVLWMHVLRKEKLKIEA